MQTVKSLVLFGFAGLVCLLFSFRKVESTNWITLEEAQKQLATSRRPVLIDLYTDWCGWCKVMDKKTYANKNVSAYLKEKFYTVKVNAESQRNIKWMGRDYAFNSQYRTNDFAMFLTRGQLSYPTTVIIPTDGSGPQAIPGYLAPADFELVVKYFGEEKFGKIPFEDYRKNFKSSW